MISGFIFAIALVLGGLAVMRFGIFQIRNLITAKPPRTRAIAKINPLIILGN
jgi:hypothetical protein